MRASVERHTPVPDDRRRGDLVHLCLDLLESAVHRHTRLRFCACILQTRFRKSLLDSGGGVWRGHARTADSPAVPEFIHHLESAVLRRSVRTDLCRQSSESQFGNASDGNARPEIPLA